MLQSITFKEPNIRTQIPQGIDCSMKGSNFMTSIVHCLKNISIFSDCLKNFINKYKQFESENDQPKFNFIKSFCNTIINNDNENFNIFFNEYRKLQNVKTLDPHEFFCLIMAELKSFFSQLKNYNEQDDPQSLFRINIVRQISYDTIDNIKHFKKCSIELEIKDTLEKSLLKYLDTNNYSIVKEDKKIKATVKDVLTKTPSILVLKFNCFKKVLDNDNNHIETRKETKKFNINTIFRVKTDLSEDTFELKAVQFHYGRNFNDGLNVCK